MPNPRHRALFPMHQVQRLQQAMQPPVRQLPGYGFPAMPGYPPGMLRQAQMGAVAEASPPSDVLNDPRYQSWNKIPAWFVLTIAALGGVTGDTSNNTVQLRPEPFVLYGISWSTTGDTHPFVNQFPGFSLQGRSVTMEWGDEFTKLFGSAAAPVSAVLGDSNGFLPIPHGATFQGKQTLNIKLTRLQWPSSLTAAATRWDFVFYGVSLLPPGVNQSGSAG